MTNRRIALVTARAARDLDDDLPPLITALRAAGAEVSVPDWDDPRVDWGACTAALLRSTWDYTLRLAEFRAWTERVSTLTHLLNPLPVVRWNTDKHYLRDLDNAGIAIVPSAFIEPGDDAGARLDAFLDAHANAEFVVKPAIGAGSRDAQRYAHRQRDAAVEHVQRLIDAQRSVLLQPYLSRVDEHGETALIYFAGKFSHAIRKGPLLRPNEGPTRALFAAEHISPRTPEADELRLAERTLAAMPFPSLLYARVDIIHDAAHRPCVLELELTEPSLFFAHSAGAAERFAAAILAWPLSR